MQMEKPQALFCDTSQPQHLRTTRRMQRAAVSGADLPQPELWTAAEDQILPIHLS